VFLGGVSICVLVFVLDSVAVSGSVGLGFRWVSMYFVVRFYVV